jgi:hypothetical protein
VVDEPPRLARPEKRREGARIGARAAGEIDDCYLVAMREIFKRGVADRGVAREKIGALAQSEPLRFEPRHTNSARSRRG